MNQKPATTPKLTSPESWLNQLRTNDIKIKIMALDYGERYFELFGQAVIDHGVQSAIDMCFSHFYKGVTIW